MSQPPSGTLTFLFTDLEGSTRLWEEQPDAMRAALALHDELLRGVIESHDGYLVKSTGDGAFAVFGNAHDGVGAAIASQLALLAAEWPEGVVLRGRMGLHVGPAVVEDGDYFGPDVNRTARLMSVAHAGQIVCSGAVCELVRERFTLVDLGEHRLRDLQSSVHVFQVDAPGLGSEFPPLRSLDALPGNLPRQVTTFVGRQTEIDALAELVRTAPLVTLTGVGGVGKTRLALQVAAEVVTDFPDGAWMCEFAPVADPGVVWETLAASLRVQAFPGRSLEESVLEYLTAKRLLLVLDNCEHLLDAIARQVAAIAQRCAAVSVLATSREGLALGGERIVAVPSLGVPIDDADVGALIAADAVQLFSDRANAARSDFELTDRNVAAVGVLCRRLDGIPLAIELAAARVRSMSPEDLVARLDQRFKLLTRGSRAALERHQTLRSTIDWSYDLLDPTERHALDCLSVFAGSCDLASAEAVLASDELDVLDVIDVLGQLVDKSLVVADNDADGGVRYRLLESIRQYGAERLQADGETAEVRRRHADHYVAVAESAAPHLRMRGQAECAQLMLRDTDNFRAVLDWAVDTPSPEHALRLVVPFTVTSTAIGVAAQEWAETAITIPGAEEHPLFSEVVAWAALAASLAVDFERAAVLVGRAVAAEATLPASSAAVLRARGVLALFHGEVGEAEALAREWVDLARAADDPYSLAHALLLLTGAFAYAESDARIATLEETIRVARDAGIASALAIALPFLASSLPIEASDRALILLDEAIDVSRRLGDRMGVALVTGTKSGLAFQRGALRTALRAAADGAEEMLALGGFVTIKDFFYVGAASLSALGQEGAAAVVIGKADALSSVVGDDHWIVKIGAGEVALGSLGSEEVAALKAQGAAFGNAEAVAFLRAHADAVLNETEEREGEAGA